MTPARSAWTAAHRRQRIERRTGAELYRLACECAGVDPHAESFTRPMMYAQRIFTGLERLDRPVAGRYERTRTVLNCFGRLNPWGRATVSYRDTQRVHALRARLLQRQMVAPEPGGYVTGLLSDAPAKMWWENYPSPLAAMSPADVALFNGTTREMAA